MFFIAHVFECFSLEYTGQMKCFVHFTRTCEVHSCSEFYTSAINVTFRIYSTKQGIIKIIPAKKMIKINFSSGDGHFSMFLYPKVRIPIATIS